MRTCFLPYWRTKLRPRRRRKSDVSSIAVTHELNFCLLGGPKCEMFEVEKAMFQRVLCPTNWFPQLWLAQLRLGSNGTSNLFSASWKTQNTTWAMCRKRCFDISSRPLHWFRAFWPGQNVILEAIFQDVDWPCDFIFSLIGDLKCSFLEVEKLQFKGSPVPLIFCFLNGRKRDLGTVT
jgi:hypothetical protein